MNSEDGQPEGSWWPFWDVAQQIWAHEAQAGEAGVIVVRPRPSRAECGRGHWTTLSCGAEGAEATELGGPALAARVEAFISAVWPIRVLEVQLNAACGLAWDYGRLWGQWEKIISGACDAARRPVSACMIAEQQVVLEAKRFLEANQDDLASPSDGLRGALGRLREAEAIVEHLKAMRPP